MTETLFDPVPVPEPERRDHAIDEECATCTHPYRAHYGPGPCMSAYRNFVSTVCPCQRFVPKARR